MTNKFDHEAFNKQETWRILEDKPGSYYQEATEEERELMREWTKGLLKERKVELEFVKSDGTLRKMSCTLNEDLGAVYVNKLPTEKDEAKKPNLDTCVVWDCEANGWRSFRWDRLKRIEFNLG